MATINLPFAASGSRRAPNSGELSGGYPCGPLDEKLDNWLEWFSTGQIAYAIDAGGLTVDDAILLRLAQAIQSGKSTYAVATGSANAWTVAPNLAVPAYSAGRVLNIIAPATNTSTIVNMNVSTLGNRRIKKSDGSDPAIGDLVSGRVYVTIDDGMNVRILTPLASDVAAQVSIVGRTQIFTASGTFTLPDGVTSVEIEGWGAGGSGGASSDGVGLAAGSAGAGGGAGGYFYKRIFGLAAGSSVAVIVGAGGLPLADASQYPPPASQTGGSTSFGPHATATGGKGGPSGRNALIAGGDGGAASGGDINVSGARGGTGGPTGTFQAEYMLHVFNKGGLPGRPIGNVDSFGTGAAGRGFGVGGNGASGGSAVAGGAGAPGLLIVRW